MYCPFVNIISHGMRNRFSKNATCHIFLNFLGFNANATDTFETEPKDFFEKNVTLRMTFVRPFLDIFFAICVFIFHKTEVLTVILRSLTGLNLDWV